MSDEATYADSLEQQARWIREALDPGTREQDRIELQDVDTDEMDAAAKFIREQAAEIERMKADYAKLSESFVDLEAERTRLLEALKDLLGGCRMANAGRVIEVIDSQALAEVQVIIDRVEGGGPACAEGRQGGE